MWPIALLRSDSRVQLSREDRPNRAQKPHCCECEIGFFVVRMVSNLPCLSGRSYGTFLVIKNEYLFSPIRLRAQG